MSTQAIAVVGLACRLPRAPGVEHLRELLWSGVDAISEIPFDRWRVDELYAPYPGEPGKMYVRSAGFLEHVDEFDPAFFSISPREAARMDPQQRLFLQVVWEALENAGIPPSTLSGSRTGVFAGVSNYDYLLLQGSGLESIDGHTLSGILPTILANRVSYALDLRGPSLTIDTACSASLVAIHTACGSLRAGECTVAIAGGSNLILHPSYSIALSQMRALAPDGRCKAFDARANGFARAEGVGAVVLKRLSDALAEGDQVWAVIRGSAVNQDGRSNGLTAPNRRAQEAVIKDALAAAGLGPTDVQYVEAHGTGTPLGDPIEASALNAVYGQGRPMDDRLQIGSIKTNIGHAEAAAGVAGLLKVILALRDAELPRNLHFETPNPHIDFEAMPLEVVSEHRPWPATRGPRRAGLSSFGIGGANAHMIVEAPPERPPRPAAKTAAFGPGRTRLLPISAKHPHSLAQRVDELRETLHGNSPLGDIAYHASVRLDHWPYRAAVVCSSSEEGAIALKQAHALAQEMLGTRPLPRAPKLVFVFSGQGSQWVGMGRGLLEESRAFRETMERCDELIREYAGFSVIEQITSPDARIADLAEHDIIQPSIFAMQVALAELWRSVGIVPDAVTGQSMGEFAAAAAAGALDLEDAAYAICRRSQLQRRVAGRGAMAAFELSLERAREWIRDYEGRVEISGSNSLRVTVLAGELEPLAELEERARAEDIFTRRVRIDVATHTFQMEPLRESMLDELDRLKWKVPHTPMASTVTGRLEPGLEADARYWWRNLRYPVLLSQAVESLLDHGYRAFVEVSPHPVVLTSLFETIHHVGARATAVHTLRKDTDWERSFLDALGQLYQANVDPDWSALFSGPRPHVSLPSYPWLRERCWFEPAGLSSPTLRGQDRHSRFPPTRETRSKHPSSLTVGMDATAIWQVRPEFRREVLLNQLTRRFARLLRTDPASVDVARPMVELGLDSITAMELGHSLEQVFGVSIPTSRLLRETSLVDLTVPILGGYADTRLEAPRVPEIRGVVDQLPLTEGQRALYFEDRLAPERGAYNVALAIRVEGPLDEGALRVAYATMVERHPSLRATFHVDLDGMPVQCFCDEVHVDFESDDIDNWADRVLSDILAEEAHRPFDLTAGPVHRMRVYRRTPEEHAILLVFHHLVIDLWSLAELVDQLLAAYQLVVEGNSPSIVPSSNYYDFVSWQAEWLASSEAASHLAYWQSEIAPHLGSRLPLDRPRPVSRTFAGEEVPVFLRAETVTSIRRTAEELGVTAYSVLLSAYQLLLHRYQGGESVMVATPTAGRVRPVDRSTIGYFVNVMLVPMELREQTSFRECVSRVHERVTTSLDHQGVPLPAVLRTLEAEYGDLTRNPVDAFFVYQRGRTGTRLGELLSGSRGIAQVGELELQWIPIEQRTAKFPLTLTVFDQADRGMKAFFTFDRDLLERGTVEGMASGLVELLEAGLTKLEEPTHRLPIASAPACASPPAAVAETVVESFFEYAASQEERVAVRCGEAAVTYRELRARVLDAAQRLVELGVGPDVVVALALPRSVDAIVGMLATLSAGNAYVALDLEYPVEWQNEVLELCGAQIVMVCGDAPFELPRGVTRVDLSEIPPHAADFAAAVPDPASLAYVVFTSGSTGKPKGVAVEHRQLAAYVSGLKYRLGLAHPSFANVSSLTADLGNTAIYGALCGGGTLHLMEYETTLSPDRFADYAAHHSITALKVVPSHLSALLESERAAELLPKAVLVCGGEALSWDLVDQLHELAPSMAVLNHYGPAETTIGVTTHMPRGPRGTTPSVPIGEPLAGTTAVVVDTRLEPLPSGATGELLIGGPQVARGYVNRPVETARRFIPLDAAPGAGARFYRTGDRVRRTEERSLVFLGRLDDQVKISGFRVEPSQVESVLRSHPAVGRAVVLSDPRRDPRRLRAFVTLHERADSTLTSRDALIEECRRRLPWSMVPSDLTILDAIPHTSNGKVDRTALLAMAEEPYAKPRQLLFDSVEYTLARLFSEVIGRPAISPEDDFFELGGNSLAAIRLQARVRTELKRSLPLAVFFQNPTVRVLARALRSAPPDGPISPDTLLRRGDGPHRIWFVHTVGGGLLGYTNIVRHLPESVDVWGLHAPETMGGDPLPGGLSDHADAYAEALSRRQPSGLVHLAGWSSGGILAFEVARHLRQRGREIGWVALFDSRPPMSALWNLEPDNAELLSWWLMDQEAQRGRNSKLGLNELTRLDRQARFHRALAYVHDEGLAPEEFGSDQLRELMVRLKTSIGMLAERMDPLPVEESALLFQGTRSPSVPLDEMRRGWEALFREVEVMAMDDDHYSMLGGESAATIASALAARLRDG